MKERRQVQAPWTPMGTISGRAYGYGRGNIIEEGRAYGYGKGNNEEVPRPSPQRTGANMSRANKHVRLTIATLRRQHTSEAFIEHFVELCETAEVGIPVTFPLSILLFTRFDPKLIGGHAS